MECDHKLIKHIKLPSDRHELIDLLGKIIDWFLYDRNFGV